MSGLGPFQSLTLVVMRTLIGWHFLYEGMYKLLLPGWTREGGRLAAWSARGYLQASTGPLSPWLRGLADSSASAYIDLLVPVGLFLVGLSLMLGLFTRLGLLGAMAFLAMFYASMPPTSGLPQPGAEGAYLLVNKNLIELAACLVLLAFPTGAVAGLDRVVRLRRRRAVANGVPVTVQE